MRIQTQSRQFTLLLGLCAGLPALSIDFSAPALPLLPTALGTTTLVAGLSLSLFMAGFALGQFTGGRASDRLGRRPVLLASIALYVAAGVCCAIATSGGQLATARLFQGAAAGGCAVQAPAIVQDLFEGEAARRKQASVTLVLTIVPMLAPALGALMLTYASWRGMFVALTLGGAGLGAAILLRLGESRRPAGRDCAAGLGVRLSLQLLRDRLFRPTILINGLSYGTIFAYIAGAPVVVMEDLGQPPWVYVGLFASTALALTAGAAANARWSGRGVGSERLVGPALAAQAAASVLLALLAADLRGPGALLSLPLLWVGAFARGVIAPNMVHLAVSRHRENAGLASALSGLAQLMLGAAASTVVAALLPPYGAAGVAVPMAALACGSLLLWRQTMRAPGRIV